MNTKETTEAVAPPQGEPHYELTSPLAEQAENLHFLVGHWAERDNSDRTLASQTPGSIRSDAIITIDAMLGQLNKLRSELVREGIAYQEQLLSPKDLGECSRSGCTHPAIEGKVGYMGPLYCGPRCAFVDRENRQAAAR